MSRGSVRWIVLASAVSTLGLAVACGGSDTCVQSKCSSGAWMHIPLPSGTTGLAGAPLTVCRNVECYAATLPAVPSADSTGASVFFPGTSPVVATLWQQVDQTVVLDVEWHVSDSSQAVDGDHYVVTLTTAAGAPTTLLDKTAAYHLTEPNPEECTPATRCSIAELAP
jgi:hypothetical protein